MADPKKDDPNRPENRTRKEEGYLPDSKDPQDPSKLDPQVPAGAPLPTSHERQDVNANEQLGEKDPNPGNRIPI